MSPGTDKAPANSPKPGDRLTGTKTTVTISVDEDSFTILQNFPWHKPLETWKAKEARFVQVKSGLSRHCVRFVRARRKSFAIKETSGESAQREFAAYVKLGKLGLPTLHPVGTVIRRDEVALVETAAGKQAEAHETGYVITGLLEYSIPHYYLFRRPFAIANRRRIWDTVVRLFVDLHCKGVYWGDASLSNMMIVFAKEHFPEIGIRTILRAVLADAETVELQAHLSGRMRMADVDHFIESMEWTEQDMRSAGILREPLMTEGDRKYILDRYAELFEIEREEQSFELLTKIDVDALLGSFERRGEAKALLKHIFEHRWYLGERAGREVPLEDAARNWYVNVFKPVLTMFDAADVIREFPDHNAVSLYLEMMEHKYYLSQHVGKDVGLSAAFESYSKQFRDRSHTMDKLMKLAKAVRNLIPS